MRAVARLAEQRLGLAPVSEAREAGLTRSAQRNAVRRGRLDQLTPRVLRLSGSPVTDRQLVLAAILASAALLAIGVSLGLKARLAQWQRWCSRSLWRGRITRTAGCWEVTLVPRCSTRWSPVARELQSQPTIGDGVVGHVCAVVQWALSMPFQFSPLLPK